MQRHTDVVIVGATAENLARAAELALTGTSVIVIDAVGAHDAPGKEAARRHGVEVLAARAIETTTAAHGATVVTLSGGHSIVARPVAGQDKTGNERDWDERYSGEQIWSGNPNGTLVNEVSGFAAAARGRALDVGAGEGGDAVWLAEQGWTVTANDVSQRALDRVAAEARRRNLNVTLLHASANTPNAFPKSSFDLVSAQYASIPRRADDAAIANIVDAVAPGGTLLVVGHDLAPMRATVDTSEHSRVFDPDAYVRPDDFARAVQDDASWEIVKHTKVPRPAGSATGHHHVDDIVFRARRRT
ncbi:MAG: class I SAM-dependent methyltransferase [Acidimicrobiia bacterium]